ncbi:MAG TPA: TonB family protein [Gammaproteobacteria bacterium]|nr:TonB family protein [Gammaproteobacteria bacterium]
MQALRYPFAISWGGLITLALFYALFRLVSVPVAATGPIVTQRIDFTHVRKPTAVHPKRSIEKPVRPTLPPKVTRVVITEGPHGPPTIYKPQGPTITEHGRISTTALGKDQDAVPFVRMNPTYPPRAATDGTEGWVKVQFTITATGAVSDLKVVDAEPKGVFEKATLDAVQRWRYSPKVENGVAVERVGVQTVITFKLNSQ